MKATLINGAVANCLNVQDRSIQYGDGLFETIAVIQDRPQHWDRHMWRLVEGCRRLGIPAPDLDTLANETMQVCHGMDKVVVKIIITRGIGGRGYKQATQTSPSRIVSAYTWPEFYDHHIQGINVRFCEIRLGSNPALAGIKHLNRLEHVMARAEWSDDTINEGLLMDLHDNIIEGTVTNIFTVHNNELHTPDLSMCGVEGVMRGVVLDLAKQNDINCNIDKLTKEQTKMADEVFVTNSLIGIWPVKTIEGFAEYPVPGEITQGLIHKLGEINN